MPTDADWHPKFIHTVDRADVFLTRECLQLSLYSPLQLFEPYLICMVIFARGNLAVVYMCLSRLPN